MHVTWIPTATSYEAGVIPCEPGVDFGQCAYVYPEGIRCSQRSPMYCYWYDGQIRCAAHTRLVAGKETFKPLVTE